jgi:hypothetical protein
MPPGVLLMSRRVGLGGEGKELVSLLEVEDPPGPVREITVGRLFHQTLKQVDPGWSVV